MDTQKERDNTQEYSDIKVSKETNKVLRALEQWSILLERAYEIGFVDDDRFESEFVDPLYKVRDKLEEFLIESITIQQHDCRGHYTYQVI